MRFGCLRRVNRQPAPAIAWTVQRAMGRPQATLASLPSELVDAISRRLPPAACAALGDTCRALRAVWLLPPMDGTAADQEAGLGELLEGPSWRQACLAAAAGQLGRRLCASTLWYSQQRRGWLECTQNIELDARAQDRLGLLRAWPGAGCWLLAAVAASHARLVRKHFPDLQPLAGGSTLKYRLVVRHLHTPLLPEHVQQMATLCSGLHQIAKQKELAPKRRWSIISKGTGRVLRMRWHR